MLHSSVTRWMPKWFGEQQWHNCDGVAFWHVYRKSKYMCVAPSIQHSVVAEVYRDTLLPVIIHICMGRQWMIANVLPVYATHDNARHGQSFAFMTPPAPRPAHTHTHTHTLCWKMWCRKRGGMIKTMQYNMLLTFQFFVNPENLQECKNHILTLCPQHWQMLQNSCSSTNIAT